MATLKTSIDKSTQLEVRVYNEQYEYIKEHFDKVDADLADYGYSVNERKDGLRISTMVYNRGILTSVASFDSIKVLMVFEPFE